MNREEILERKRDENFDEGGEYVKNKWLSRGTTSMLLLIMILSAYNLFKGIAHTNLALFSVYFMYLGFEGRGMYSVTHKTWDLIKVVAGFCISAYFLIEYLIGTIS